MIDGIERFTMAKETSSGRGRRTPDDEVTKMKEWS